MLGGWGREFMPYTHLNSTHYLRCTKIGLALYVGSNSTHSLTHSLTNQTNHIDISNPDRKPKPLCLSTPRRNTHTYNLIQAEHLALSCLLLLLFLDETNFYGSPQNSVRELGRTSGRAACPFLSRHWAVPYVSKSQRPPLILQ